MAQKRVMVPELGEVLLSKRRGTRNLRLSVTAKGEIRVGMPSWAPYAAGIRFALSRKDWLLEHTAAVKFQPIKIGDRVGKSFRVVFEYQPAAKTTSVRLVGNSIKVTGPSESIGAEAESKIVKAAERALKKEAESLLPNRVKDLAAQKDFNYHSVLIKKLVSRWGSCSNQKVISLSFFLMQLPWELIDYVILHELVHTKHLNHSSKFWTELEAVCPDYRQKRRRIKKYRPVINAVAPDVA